MVQDIQEEDSASGATEGVRHVKVEPWFTSTFGLESLPNPELLGPSIDSIMAGSGVPLWRTDTCSGVASELTLLGEAAHDRSKPLPGEERLVLTDAVDEPDLCPCTSMCAAVFVSEAVSG
jgi:hypothetical protein